MQIITIESCDPNKISEHIQNKPGKNTLVESAIKQYHYKNAGKLRLKKYFRQPLNEPATAAQVQSSVLAVQVIQNVRL